MLVTPEQESGDADTLVVAEFDQATRSVADLTEATLTGHTRRWRRSPKSGSEPMLVAPEQESGDADDLVVAELEPELMLVNPEQRPGSSGSKTHPAPDSPTSQRPTITSRLRAKLRGF